MTYQLGLTPYTDMTSSEFASSQVGCITHPLLRPERDTKQSISKAFTSPPKSVDWREMNVISPVQSQGNCGSCYAFAVVGAIESSLAMKTGQLNQYSVQQIVDCSKSYGNSGCLGGAFAYTYTYIMEHGLTTEENYPYEGEFKQCKNVTAVIGIESYELVAAGDESVLDQYVAKQPVAVTLSASSASFQVCAFLCG